MEVCLHCGQPSDAIQNHLSRNPICLAVHTASFHPTTTNNARLFPVSNPLPPPVELAENSPGIIPIQTIQFQRNPSNAVPPPQSGGTATPTFERRTSQRAPKRRRFHDEEMSPSHNRNAGNTDNTSPFPSDLATDTGDFDMMDNAPPPLPQDDDGDSACVNLFDASDRSSVNSGAALAPLQTRPLLMNTMIRPTLILSPLFRRDFLT